MSLITILQSGQEPPELIRSIVKLGFSNADVEEFSQFASTINQTGITFYSLDIDDVETLKDVATESVFLFYVNNEKVDHVRGWNEDEMNRLTQMYFGEQHPIIESEDLEPIECDHQSCFCNVDLSKLKLK